MSSKADSEIKSEMENEMPNEELGSTNTYFTIEDPEEKSLYLRSIPPSPTCTENSLSTFSSLSINNKVELSELKNTKTKSKSEASNRSYCHKSRELGTLSETAESIYNLKRSIRNPITGDVTKISAAHSRPNTGSTTSNSSGIVSTGKQHEVSKIGKTGGGRCDIKFLDRIKPQLQIETRRNPITGEGIDPTYCPTNIKNYKRSGIRVNQPPGGLSTGIF